MRPFTPLKTILILLTVVSLAACASPTTVPTVAPASPTDAPTAVPPTEAPTSQAVATEPEPVTVAGFPVTITDGNGTELTFDKPPERVACLYTRCTEILAALGITPIALPGWIADVAADPAYFEQPNDIVILKETSDANGFDLEELAALGPDLILGWDELRAPFEGIAQVHSVTNDLDTYEESNDEIRTFAKLFGREEAGEAAIEAFLNRLEAYKALSPKDRSVMNTWISDVIYYRDGQSGTCNLFKEVALCDWVDPANASTWSVAVSVEGLLQLNPDVILTDVTGFETEDALLAELGKDPLWGEISAFKEKRIFFIPANIHNMDGMGPIGAARMLDVFMPLIYPEVFPQPLTDEQVQAALSQ